MKAWQFLKLGFVAQEIYPVKKFQGKASGECFRSLVNENNIKKQNLQGRECTYLTADELKKLV